ncbi:MAG: prepilin-type N-terminal cleavage/methylation domain-containing protein, partial [Povalibacter sp.]
KWLISSAAQCRSHAFRDGDTQSKSRKLLGLSPIRSNNNAVTADSPTQLQRPNRALGMRSRSRAFTLLELMAAVAIAALLTTIALPTYRQIIERQKVSTAISDLARIAMAIEKFRTQHFEPPMSLAEVGMDGLRDPWGNAYRYLNFNSPVPGVKGKIRKDHNLHPLNSEFDLYSMGPDGDSKSPLTAKASRDDILWARDGSFIGKASDF